MLQSRLLQDTVQITSDNSVLILNSAANPFVLSLAQRLRAGTLTLAEDSVAVLDQVLAQLRDVKVQETAFHDYILHYPGETQDIALLDLLYQPSNAWMLYALQVAHYALRIGGRLYVVGAKDRGIVTMAKRMQDAFGNVETLTIGKGHRVLCSSKRRAFAQETSGEQVNTDGDTKQQRGRPLGLFADNKLDEGTQLLIEALDLHTMKKALDIGCGAGFIGLHIAREAPESVVTMVDVSRVAVATAQQAVVESGLKNIQVVASDGAQAVLTQRFDLVVTNPPFHQGGIQTTAIAERFIREAAQVLLPKGYFYLVANRFLKYEPVLCACFKHVEEVGGNSRYKVLQASGSSTRQK